MKPIFGFAAFLLLSSVVAPSSALASSGPGAGLAVLTGIQEPGAAAAAVPPGASTATGRATFRLDEDGKSLRFSLSAQGLIGAKFAQIHLCGAGTTRPLVGFRA